LKKFLSRHNLDVVIATNGKKGIDAFKQETQTLFLLIFGWETQMELKYKGNKKN